MPSLGRNSCLATGWEQSWLPGSSTPSGSPLRALTRSAGARNFVKHFTFFNLEIYGIYLFASMYIISACRQLMYWGSGTIKATITIRSGQCYTAMDYNNYNQTVRRYVATDNECPDKRTIIITKSFPDDMSSLWDAVTDPKRLVTWFAPVQGELRLNGHYSISGNASGIILECNAPYSYALSWKCQGQSILQVKLADSGNNRTDLTLRHIVDVDDHWRKYGPGAVGVGWDLTLLGLMLHMEGFPKPSEEQFAASKQATAFTKSCSDAWMGEAVRAGEDVTWARNAAEETTKFYVPY